MHRVPYTLLIGPVSGILAWNIPHIVMQIYSAVIAITSDTVTQSGNILILFMVFSIPGVINGLLSGTLIAVLNTQNYFLAGLFGFLFSLFSLVYAPSIAGNDKMGLVFAVMSACGILTGLITLGFIKRGLKSGFLGTD